MLKLNQKGFAHIQILLLAMAVAVIGGIGWYVYDQNKKPEKISESVHYLEVKEWSVRIPLDDDSHDMYYQKSDLGNNVLEFRLKRQDSLYEDCKPDSFTVQSGTATDTYMSHTKRIKFEDAYEKESSSPLEKKIDDRYFIQSEPSPSYSCEKNLESGASAQEDLLMRFLKTTVSKLEKI